ncbi:MAG: UPF0175 family protein [Syntrophomonadaceae bacterium]|nr:UPF0175 family protein [Syntrophomonadaceae bacterium]
MVIKESSVSVSIPNELLPLLRDLANGKSVDENVRISLAIGLFVSKTVSLARAGEIAGLSLNDFIFIVKTKNIPWVDYTETDLDRDEMAVQELIRNWETNDSNILPF